MLVQQTLQPELEKALIHEFLLAVYNFQNDPSAINYQQLEIAMRYWQNYKKNCTFGSYLTSYAISSVEEFKARTDQRYTEASLRYETVQNTEVCPVCNKSLDDCEYFQRLEKEE